MEKRWCKTKCTCQSSTIFEYRKNALNYQCFSPQFNYCPVTWMFHNESLNHKSNRCLRHIYNDGHSSLWWIIKCRQFCVKTPLEFTDFSNRNVQGIHWSATDILNEVFPLKPPSNYNWRNQPEFTVRPIKTVHYGLNSLAYLGPK